MYTYFNSHLGVDKNQLSKEMIVLSDTNIDGNFLLHHFISNALNNEEKVCLIGFSQTFSHYLNAGHKIGVNLQKYVDSKHFVFLDGLQWIYDSFMDEKDEDSSDILSNAEDPHFSLKMLFDLIVQNTSDYEGPSIVLIDDFCSLVSIGISVQTISNFLHYCKTLTFKNDMSFVFLAHADDDDPDNVILHAWLKRYMTLEVNVSALKTGYSRDLSGEMNITRKSQFEYSKMSKKLHFKLFDKGVKFFAPGTSSAVL